MDFSPDRHATDDQLERYAMGRLAGPELEQLEEHLLICRPCQDRLALEDAFRQGVRDAGPSLPHARWKLPKPVWVVGLAAMLAAVVAVPLARFRATPPPVVVSLDAVRGAQETPRATAPPGRPITLALDLAGLPPFAQYRLEVVDAAGRPVFESQAVSQNGGVRATLARGLGQGAYFVRLYAPSQELLREYALTCGR